MSFELNEAQFRAILQRVWTLEERVRELEARLGQTPGPAPGAEQRAAAVPPIVPAAPVDTAPTALPPHYPTAPPPRERPFPRVPRRTSVDLEALIAGQWLNYIGIVALIFGV